ncbi:MAG: endonuclease/exonuclease/phosphatase family protein [Gammaproteobacteria bacterium]|nr:endonuclease/exonuclease/phosphatase family protein [Gammaproteobacteria bacterium]
MRLILLLVPLVAACTPPATDTGPGDAGPSFETVGRLENPAIDEASGLARSQRNSGVLWVINDDGDAEVHAINSRGANLGRVKLSKTNNNDWEDLASFTLEDEAYLLIAAVGDNDGKRKDVTVHVVEEPKLDDKKVKVAWEIEYEYEDGPRDAEAVAIDVENERVLVLSKRDIPAVLYEVPLRPGSKKRQIARRLGTVASLPQPKRQDVRFAPKTDDWYWQPTGMDISPNGRSLVVLTYGGVFLYQRTADESWANALQRKPQVLGTTRNRQAEAVAFNDAGDAIYITLEQRNAPLIRATLPIAQAPGPEAVSIMTFNVQNLFDNVDDPDKDDKAYLPIEKKQNEAHKAACNAIEVESWRNECLYLDWNDAAIEHKLGVLADTIRQVSDGRGADIVALQEVENLAILERLRTEYLVDGEYLPGILIEGSDNRGIDVAFLSRLPVVGETRLHPLKFDDFPERAGDTRGVLEATFELPDGSLLTGFSVHFPAPFHPTEMRVLAFEHLNDIRNALPPERNVFAAGDFNTTSSENGEQGMLERFVRPSWTVAHDNCDGCPGTQYYSRDKTWSFLDTILYSPASGTDQRWQIAPGSVALVNKLAAQVTKDGTPARYYSAERVGVSDHWPLVLTIELRP